MRQVARRVRRRAGQEGTCAATPVRAGLLRSVVSTVDLGQRVETNEKGKNHPKVLPGGMGVIGERASLAVHRMLIEVKDTAASPGLPLRLTGGPFQGGLLRQGLPAGERQAREIMVQSSAGRRSQSDNRLPDGKVLRRVPLSWSDGGHKALFTFPAGFQMETVALLICRLVLRVRPEVAGLQRWTNAPRTVYKAVGGGREHSWRRYLIAVRTR